MSRRGVLAQQLNAIESLASVDTICVDKTGTLTEAALRVVELIAAPGVAPTEELRHALATFAAGASTRNVTLAGDRRRLPGEAGAAARAEVPFASRRRWSAMQPAGTTLYLGAPERLPARRARADGGRANASGPGAACSRSPRRRRRCPRRPPTSRPAG